MLAACARPVLVELVLHNSQRQAYEQLVLQIPQQVPSPLQ